MNAAAWIVLVLVLWLFGVVAAGIGILIWPLQDPETGAPDHLEGSDWLAVGAALLVLWPLTLARLLAERRSIKREGAC